MFAAIEGNLEICRLLIYTGCKIDITDGWGQTALMRAARGGDLEICRLLIDTGCKIDTTAGSGLTALMFAAEGGHLEICRLLIDTGCKINTTNGNGVTALMYAARGGHLEICRLLIDTGCKIDITDTITGYTALHCAAQGGYLQITRCLVEQGGASPLVTNRLGQTPYDLAAAVQYKEVMEYLQSVMLEESSGVTASAGQGMEGKVKGDDDGGASCFSATSIVFTESRGYITLNNLTIGEKVLSMNKNNELHFSEVIMFLHRDVNSQSVFLIVETESRRKLYISKKHLIYIADSPSYKTLRPTLAESIRVGQYILGISSSTDASLKFSKVVRVDHVTRNGVFAPLTEDGKIIVDGVLASCYANIHSDDLAHFAFLPARSFYTLNKHLIYPMIGLNSTSSISEGIHWYADALLYLGKLLLGTRNLVLSI